MTFLATSFFATYCAATLRFRFLTTKNISRRRFTAVLAVLIQTGLYNLYTFFEFSNPNSLFFFYDILKSLDYRNYSFRTSFIAVSYTHLRAHETPEHLVCRLLLEKKKKKTTK